MNEAMDALEARVHRQLNRMRDLADQMAAVRVRETSPDGAVTAVVDGNGALVDLELSGAITKLSPAEFERILVSTAASAARRAFAERGALVTSFNEEVAEYA
ncbi:YbaB/EbfC family nucleoid-associated protein [Nocardia amamiensis]|uniref:YbaB/EbfC family nucleoid-associated protein n=1 Tax=Nocardia amamiensis TaxID=404578 RepID=A0ABS0CM13_9NOCA|nr:YbaB/EbfC family nucleoid-associated protein [Nocardia amamiensis]MBF6297646.1 YbaB/EbfC family nucleoid-associated protein [Nocardia amamiensis]